MAAFHFLVLITSIFCLLSQDQIAYAQYAQDYEPDTTRPGEYVYRPIPNNPTRPVINLSPVTVFLHYNCYYMKDICINAQQFAFTPRGQSLHPLSGLPKIISGEYDLDTGDSLPFFPQYRQENRRSASCPNNWAAGHPCPETGFPPSLPPPQQPVMRQDGLPWFTTATEPGTAIYELMNHRDINGNIDRYSNVRYTCDEFPPATWVYVSFPFFTKSLTNNHRCAAMSCAPASQPVTKSEQNWQGISHGLLRNILEVEAEGDGHDISERNSIILFRFIPDNNGPDDVVASVTISDDPDTSDAQAEYAVHPLRIRAEGHETSIVPRPLVTRAELQSKILAGKARQVVVHTNLSMTSITGMNAQQMHTRGYAFRGDQEQVLGNETLNDDFQGQFGSKSTKFPPNNAHFARRIDEHTVTPLLKRATMQDVQAARAIVKKALAQSSRLNHARVAAPLRNRYQLKPGTLAGGRVSTSDSNEAKLPLLVITDEIAAAAALVAEADAVSSSQNTTKRAAAAAGTYWMQSLARKGTVPWGNDPNYAVFRNVLDYGAVGDGVTDDTKAFKRAMTNGTRCGEACNGSTTKNAIVYIPPGNYLLSSTIPLPFGTQVIGDANNRPTLVATASFIGLGVLSTDEYTGAPGKGEDGGDPEYYINTANFYRQIRNVVIDIRKITPATLVTCLHYQVAQATSLQNVELIALAGSTQIGLYAENGSGGQISDVTFTGGGIGLKGGSQQFTAQRLTFKDCTTGIQVIWDWGWVWKSITMTNVKTAFLLVGDGGVGNIGSVAVMDSSFTNVGTVVIVNPLISVAGKGSTGISLENIALSGVSIVVADTTGKTLLTGSGLSTVDQWVAGPVYEGSTTARTVSAGGKVGNFRRHATLLDDKGTYFERSKPQYEDLGIGSFLHVKDYGATGDGSTDDTAAFQKALYASVGKILFVDAGSYILTSTVTIPSGAKIIGETWSQLVASGSYFADASKPKVLIKVGNAGDIGNVEMQDILFTTRGATAGLVVLEWNIQADKLGSAALWDCHVRIGGATGTQLTPAECPPVTSGTNTGCSAASLMMHLTPSASGYFENMWLWVADHMLDDPDLTSPSNKMVQTSIYVARGFLIESTKPTWLYGTASEHAVFYQYNFHSAANIFAGLLQTESAYFQPTPPPPAPFAAVVGVFPGDPDYSCTGGEFSGCDESWAVVMTGSRNIFVAAAGLYSWFSTYAQTCIDSQLCQKALVLLNNNFANIRIQNLVTIGAKYMAVMNGKGIPAVDNLNVDVHPFWSQITLLDVGNGSTQFNELKWIDPKLWEMDQPAFTCSPPCHVKIPPWTGATSTVNYPLITVTAGTWTSTITKPPITITEWVFDVVTLTEGNKKRAADGFWPVPATTPYFPAIVYQGPDGKRTTTSATETFPKPPQSIGPNAPAPPSGSWPKRFIQPNYGSLENLLTEECDYLDFNTACQKQPWLMFNYTGGPLGDIGDPKDQENNKDSRTKCNLPESFTLQPPTSPQTSTSSSSTTTSSAIPLPSPFEIGDSTNNNVACFKSGRKTENNRMVSARKDFCNAIKSDDMGPGYYLSKDFYFSADGGPRDVMISVSLQINDKCHFEYNYNLCMHYFSVLADSCNCGGIDGKQGGLLKNSCYTMRVDPKNNPSGKQGGW
ncbi:pectate lyase superfamily protein-domain-containing protein [Leptodontidium sp. 2 PMI_412]|nr:pectate lyase superfamily protein-domain-containing protein [Leptodontidium sp. 2 PMI_412]